MAKTTFGPGVIVTSKWLNGAQQLYFDGLDQDWHFPPINAKDLQRGGVDGIDTTYVTVATDQEYGNTTGITGNKSFMNRVEFGSKMKSSSLFAPKSFNTNAKFNLGGSSQTFNEKFSNLEDEDIVTKEILSEQMTNLPPFDEGRF